MPAGTGCYRCATLRMVRCSRYMSFYEEMYVFRGCGRGVACVVWRPRGWVRQATAARTGPFPCKVPDAHWQIRKEGECGQFQ